MSSTNIQISRADLEQGSHISSMSAEASINLSDAGDRECRICHMGLESEGHVYGDQLNWVVLARMVLLLLTNSAETWTCETCHSVARNVFATNEEKTENLRDSYNIIRVSTTQPQTPPRFWLDRRFLEFCIFIIFFISCVFAGLFG